MVPISTKSTYFNVFIYRTLHIKFAPAVPEIQIPGTLWVFLLLVHKVCSCAPISMKFGTQVENLSECSIRDYQSMIAQLRVTRPKPLAQRVILIIYLQRQLISTMLI